MRNIWILLLVMGPVVLFGKGNTTLSGSVPVNVAQVNLHTDLLWLGDQEAMHEVEVVDGKYRFDLDLDRPHVVTLEIGERKLDIFLRPNDALEAEFSAADAKAIPLFEGTGAPDNRFFAAFQDQYANQLDPEQVKARIMDTPVDLFELDLYDTRAKMNSELQMVTGLSNTFTEFMRDHIDHYYNGWLMAFTIIRSNAAEKSMTVKNLPRTIELGLKEQAPKDDAALISSNYRRFVEHYITYFNSQDNGFQKYSDFNKMVLAKMNKASEVLQGGTLTWFNAHLTFTHCEKLAPGTLEQLQESVKEGEEGKRYMNVLNEKCSLIIAQKEEAAKEKKKLPKVKESKSSGPEKYPVRMVDLDGNPVKFSDFEGKVVYIDFWASWCGPCRRQFPFSKQLHAELEDKLGAKGMKDIVFLYVSIDKDEAAWRRAVKQFDLQGVQAHSHPTWPDNVAAYFQVNGIPRYMIMDREGNIVQNNAKRPSMPGIIDDLTNLL